MVDGMPPRPFVPEQLRHRPFSQAEGISLGLTPHMLSGPSWVRVFPRVWAHRDHQMTSRDWITAAGLTMPERAQLSHVSRLQRLGLDIGDTAPVHFTVAGDLHLDIDGIFLHRTEVMPPVDEHGVTPASAFVQLCATARLIDAVKVGDWLLHRRHMTTLEVAELVRRDGWRPGASEARRVLRHLDAAARSLPESEVRVLLAFAGLPRPEGNVPIVVDGELIGITDLLIRPVMLALEYEGRQHAESTAQFRRDIDRYAGFRRHGVEYLQITHEMKEKPRTMVMRVYSRMVELGYRGSEPVFGRRWESLFEPPGRAVRRSRFQPGTGDSVTPRPRDGRTGHRPEAG